MNELEIALASENLPRDPGRASHGKDNSMIGQGDRGMPPSGKKGKKHHRQQRKGNAQRRQK